MNYRLPILATLGAALLLFAFLAAIGLLELSFSLTELGKVANNDSEAIYGASVCGLIALVALGGATFFLVAAVKGVRDLFTPVQYTRGEVADKRVLGGRRTGSWLGVIPAYVGSDLSRASIVTEEQVAASTDRSQAFQPRLTPPGRTASGREAWSGSYIPPERLSIPVTGAADEPASAPPPHVRLIFRIEPSSYAHVEPGEEVLLAHSRFLQHVYYVAHLRSGEWESFTIKELI